MRNMAVDTGVDWSYVACEHSHGMMYVSFSELPPKSICSSCPLSSGVIVSYDKDNRIAQVDIPHRRLWAEALHTVHAPEADAHFVYFNERQSQDLYESETCEPDLRLLRNPEGNIEGLYISNASSRLLQQPGSARASTRPSVELEEVPLNEGESTQVKAWLRGASDTHAAFQWCTLVLVGRSGRNWTMLVTEARREDILAEIKGMPLCTGRDMHVSEDSTTKHLILNFYL